MPVSWPSRSTIIGLLRQTLGVGPAVVLALGLLATALGTVTIAHSARISRDAGIAASTKNIVEAYQTELEGYARILRASAAFVESFETLEWYEWAHFVDALNLVEDYPGFVGFAFVAKVPEGEIEAFEQRLQAGGAPDFAVLTPWGETTLPTDCPASIIAHHEPEAPRALPWGVALAHGPAERGVSLGVDRSGTAHLIDPHRTTPVGRNRFIMALAVHDHVADEFGADPADHPDHAEDSLTNTRGWVAAPIDIHALLSTMSNPEPHRFRLELYTASADGSSELLAEHDTNPSPRPAARRTNAPPTEVPLSFAGNDQRLVVIPQDVAENHIATQTASAVAIGGGSASVLMMLIVASISQTRSRAEQIAEAMTRSLADSEAEQRYLADRAKSASAAKSAFLANMSHEIRTPMNAILGYTDLLEESIRGPHTPETESDTEESLAAIRASSAHLLTIINDVLDLAKIEAGKLAIRPEPVNPGDPVLAVVEMMRLPAKRRGLRLESSIDASLPSRAVIDPVRVRQILINLVGNAIKFTDQGRIHIELCRDGEHHAVLRVTDTGAGIPCETLRRLFMPFEQGDHSAARRHEGTGLGLTISRRLAEMMDGTLTAESEPGRGSVFALRIPLIVAEESQSPTETHAHPLGSSSAPSEPSEGVLAGRHLLLVDDGLDNRRILTHFLRRAGATVSEAASGEEGLARCRAGDRFAMILMDYHMPGMDGPTTTAAIRAFDPHTPIVALTADTAGLSADRFREAGANGFAAKPIDRKHLIRLVLEHTGAGQSTADRQTDPRIAA